MNNDEDRWVAGFASVGDDPVPIIGCLDLPQQSTLAAILLAGMAQTQVGICLCDSDDKIRYANSVFQAAYLQCLKAEPTSFVDALAAEIKMGRGLNLDGMALEDFIPRARARRKALSAPHRFAVDFNDGSWWQVNEHKLGNGWLLVLTTEISGLKSVELKLREDHAAALKAAQTDVLTGLDNRRRGLEQAQAALDTSRRNQLPFTVALIDIDYFKRINDHHGHDVGDKVLVHFAQTLVCGLEPGDQISRIGGEEFLLVMPNTVASRARCRLDAVLRNIQPLWAEFDRKPLEFTASAGLAQAQPSECLGDLLHRADVALYEAKAKGRHRIELSPWPVRQARPSSASDLQVGTSG